MQTQTTLTVYTDTVNMNVCLPGLFFFSRRALSVVFVCSYIEELEQKKYKASRIKSSAALFVRDVR